MENFYTLDDVIDYFNMSYKPKICTKLSVRQTGSDIFVMIV